MKPQCKQFLGFTFILLLLSGVNPQWVQADSNDYIVISGIIKDKQSKKKMDCVSISVPGTNIGTVTNADGRFSLKLKETDLPKKLEISHVGYADNSYSLGRQRLIDQVIWMTPYTNLLDEVIIHPNNPVSIVMEAIKKIPANYSSQPTMLTGFYREIIQKGRRYINISEAILDIYKTRYDESVDKDRVQISKGRKLLSQKSGDTLAVKLEGGPTISLYMDIVKNPDFLMNLDNLSDYSFRMEESVNIGNCEQYVISFEPKVILPYALYYGKLYIDKGKLSFTRAEINLSMNDKLKATRAILHKKPLGLRFKPIELSCVITYKNRGDVTYLNYINSNIRFKCDWKRKLFSTNYTVLTEMVVTDSKGEDVAVIPYKNSFKRNQIFSDKVADFNNENFWENYNIIEPTESLEHAVSKLKKQQK